MRVHIIPSLAKRRRPVRAQSNRGVHILKFLARDLVGSRHGAPLAQGVTGTNRDKGVESENPSVVIQEVVVVWL